AGWLPAARGPFVSAGDFDADGNADVIYVSRVGEVQYLEPAIDDVPVAHVAYVPYRGEIPPYLSGAPWDPNNSRAFIDATSTSLHKQVNFNDRSNFEDYVYNFRDELRRWQSEAARLGLTSSGEFRAFLLDKLNEKFAATRDLLASYYPGLTDTQY